MEDLKKELEQLSKRPIFTKEFRNKKLIIYLVRTIIAAIIIYSLWDYKWVKWVLYLYVPLNLFSLISIFGWNFFLNKKIKKSQEQLDKVMYSLEEEE